MHHAVDVVHVVLVQVVGSLDGDDRFQRGRIAHRHVDGVERAPGDAEHADVAVRPGLGRKPGDDRLAILLLLVGVFVGDQLARALAGAADIDARDDIAALNEIGIDG